MRKIFGTLIILVIISAALPGAIYAQEQTCAKEYTILAGDTLSKLASKYLGTYSAYPAIIAATNARRAQDDSFAEIINPDSVEVGWKLCIPPDENAAADVTVAVTSTAAAVPNSTGLAGKIVLQTASGGQIYTVNADGSDQHPMFPDGLGGDIYYNYANERVLDWAE